MTLRQDESVATPVLVTRGSRGIGRASSKRLARDGALVAVHYGRDENPALRAGGATAFAVQALLGEEGDVDALFSSLEAVTGSRHLDIVVNNAGIALGGDLANTTLADFDALIAVNVRAPLFINQAAVERMSSGGD